MQKVSAGDQWFVLIDEQQYGPFDLADLKELAAEGRLLEGDWIWKPGLASWIAAGDVSGLFAKSAQIQTEPTKHNRNNSAEDESRKTQSNFKGRAKGQIKNFGLMFFYLWIVFGLLAVHESMILSQHQLSYQAHGVAIINALVFAKVMLVAEDLHLGHRLNDKPLIYSILYKSILFGVTLICFHIVEHVLIGMWHGVPIAETIAELGADQLGQIASGGTIATIALVPFFILREISRVIGADTFWSLFFRRRIS
jgi:GYF domain 2